MTKHYVITRENFWVADLHFSSLLEDETMGTEETVTTILTMKVLTNRLKNCFRKFTQKGKP